MKKEREGKERRPGDRVGRKRSHPSPLTHPTNFLSSFSWLDGYLELVWLRQWFRDPISFPNTHLWRRLCSMQLQWLILDVFITWTFLLDSTSTRLGFHFQEDNHNVVSTEIRATADKGLFAYHAHTCRHCTKLLAFLLFECCIGLALLRVCLHIDVVCSARSCSSIALPWSPWLSPSPHADTHSNYRESQSCWAAAQQQMWHCVGRSIFLTSGTRPILENLVQ